MLTLIRRLILGTHHFIPFETSWGIAVMAWMARIGVPGYPHHVTEGGVRSLPIFRGDEDRRSHLEFMSRESERLQVGILAGCLMTKPVHLIAVGEGEGEGDVHAEIG